MTKIWADNHQT